MGILSSLHQSASKHALQQNNWRLRLKNQPGGSRSLEFETKGSRFGHWDITGGKAKAAKKALYNYLAKTVPNEKLAHDPQFAALGKSLNTRHALRPVEIHALLSSIFGAEPGIADSVKAADDRAAVEQIVETYWANPQESFNIKLALDLFRLHSKELLSDWTEGRPDSKEMLSDSVQPERRLFSMRETFGCGLALAIVERIKRNGNISKTDVDELKAALGLPSKQEELVEDAQAEAAHQKMFADFGVDEPVAARPVPLPADLAGPLTTEKLAAILRSACAIYVEGPLPVNFQGEGPVKDPAKELKALKSHLSSPAPSETDVNLFLERLKTHWTFAANRILIKEDFQQLITAAKKTLN